MGPAVLVHRDSVAGDVPAPTCWPATRLSRITGSPRHAVSACVRDRQFGTCGSAAPLCAQLHYSAITQIAGQPRRNPEAREHAAPGLASSRPRLLQHQILSRCRIQGKATYGARTERAPAASSRTTLVVRQTASPAIVIETICVVSSNVKNCGLPVSPKQAPPSPAAGAANSGCLSPKA
jgi:hypothetical protein